MGQIFFLFFSCLTLTVSLGAAVRPQFTLQHAIKDDLFLTYSQFYLQSLLFFFDFEDATLTFLSPPSLFTTSLQLTSDSVNGMLSISVLITKNSCRVPVFGDTTYLKLSMT